MSPVPARRAREPFSLTSPRAAHAAYYVAFGPHGPRAPVDAPGAGIKIVLGVTGLVVAAGAVFYAVRAAGTWRSALCVVTGGMT